jgi:hypothetical protein
MKALPEEAANLALITREKTLYPRKHYLVVAQI